jgi:hypothetical protein
MEVISASILTSSIALSSPALFERVIQGIISGQIMPGVSEADRNKLCSHAFQNVPQNASPVASELKMKLASILETKKLASDAVTYGDDELVSMAENKSALITQRENAIKLLATRRKYDLLKSVGMKIADSVDENGWYILSKILEQINDDKYFASIISKLFEKAADEDVDSGRLLRFLNESGNVVAFVSILIQDKLLLARVQSMPLRQELQNVEVATTFARRVISDVLKGSDAKPISLTVFGTLFPDAMKSILDEACSALNILQKNTMEEKRSLIKEHENEIEKIEQAVNERVSDAISKTQQRYEHNISRLKKTVDLLEEMKGIVEKTSLDQIDGKWIKSYSSRISKVEEDISSLLSRTGIVK